MQELLLNNGIEKSTIVLLLMLPVGATMVGISRHVIGMRSLGIYLTLIITFIFFELGVTDGSIYSDTLTGFKYGFILLFIVFVSVIVSYQVIKDWTLHYYPKLSLIITISSLAVLALILTAAIFSLNGILKINVFTLILIVGLAEKFMSIFTRKSLRASLFITFEGIFLASLCYLLISWSSFIELITEYPYAIILLFPINYAVGRLRMLRLSEYFRFWSILTEEEPK